MGKPPYLARSDGTLDNPGLGMPERDFKYFLIRTSTNRTPKSRNVAGVRQIVHIPPETGKGVTLTPGRSKITLDEVVEKKFFSPA